MRSSPEKSLERWTDPYLTSRFTRADHLWPTLGRNWRLANPYGVRATWVAQVARSSMRFYRRAGVE